MLPVRFNLGSAMDRRALLLGLFDGFSWRELHENPKRRIGWRFEDAFEEKSDCGDFENLGKDCFELTESGWMEVEDPDVLDSFPDIDESDGTFATLTGEPFAWATEIEFRSPESRRSGRPVAVPTRTAARRAALRRSSRVGSGIRAFGALARRSREDRENARSPALGRAPERLQMTGCRRKFRWLARVVMLACDAATKS